MRRLWLGWALYAMVSGVARADGDDPGAAIYRYKNAHGRTVYTNAVEQIPVAERVHARVDLSRVELNSEVGTEIEHQFEQQHASLMESKYCRELRAAADVHFLYKLWDEFAPLIVCGGLLLLFLFFTPSALRRYGAPVWAKVLMMAIPSLTLAGFAMFSMTATNSALAQLKHRAEPCAKQAFTRLAGQPDALLQHARLIEQLQEQVAKIQKEGNLQVGRGL